MFKYFTRRHRLDVPKYDLRYEYVPPAFRSDLYKAVHENAEGTVPLYIFYRDAAVVINQESVRYYTAEDIETYFNPDLLIELLLSAEWHEVLSILEYGVSEAHLSPTDMNDLLEYHRVGYRLEAKPFDSKYEVVVHYESLIADAEALLEETIEYEGVLACVDTARTLLSDPRNSNIESAVKSSVDALEGYVRGWLGAKGHKVSRLGDAIPVLRKHQLAPSRIIDSLEKLYIFRNSEPNVGHGAPDKGTLSREDGLLSLEVAISFINYFHRKASKGE